MSEILSIRNVRPSTRLKLKILSLVSGIKTGKLVDEMISDKFKDYFKERTFDSVTTRKINALIKEALENDGEEIIEGLKVNQSKTQNKSIIDRLFGL